MSQTSATFITHSGQVVDLHSGAPTLEDIAISLSRIPRFAGHTILPWSVAQHSLLVGRIVRRQGWSVMAEAYALLHDAHESLTNDIPSPFKSSGMKQLQADLDERIWESVELEAPMPLLYRELIHSADMTALVTEANVLGHPHLYDHLTMVDQLRPAAETNLHLLRDIARETDYPGGESGREEWLRTVKMCLGGL